MSTVQAFTENQVNLDAFFFCLPVWPPKMVRILPVGDLCHAGLLHLGPSTAADEEGFLAGWMMMAGRCRCIPVEPVGPVGTRICVQKPVIALAQSIGVQHLRESPSGHSYREEVSGSTPAEGRREGLQPANEQPWFAVTQRDWRRRTRERVHASGIRLVRCSVCWTYRFVSRET